MMTFLKSKGHDVTGFEYYDNDDHFPNLKGMHTVIHLGAETDTTCSDIKHILERNYDFSKRLYDECQDKHIMLQYASSASVYGHNKNSTEDGLPKVMIASKADLTVLPVKKTSSTKITFLFSMEKSIFVTLGIKGFSFLLKSSLKKVISRLPTETLFLIEFCKDFLSLFAKKIPFGCKPISTELEKSL